MPPILAAENIVKEYRIPREKPLRVLDGVSLEVAPGERVAIVGRSGSGKTTLLNILGTLDAPSSGNVAICGEKMFSGFGAARRRNRVRATKIGFVFQNFQLMDELDIVENVLLPVYATGGAARSDRARAKELLESVGLGGRLGHFPKELSGGEQQRVAIARALMRRPAIVFADEPTGNLDSLTGSEILKLLLTSSDNATAVVMVTHSSEAARACGRILKLEGGKISIG